MVGPSWWESGQEPAGKPLMLKNAWVCFRKSIFLVENNLSLQFCENQRKCHQPETCYPTYGLFSAVLMRQDLHVADRLYLPWNADCKLLITLFSLISFVIIRHIQWSLLHNLILQYSCVLPREYKTVPDFTWDVNETSCLTILFLQ